MSVEKLGKAFNELYIPPLGPLDDPAGVIYLDGKLNDKTVDMRVLDSIGEGVQEARKELFDLGSRRRSLVEEIRAQNRRVGTFAKHEYREGCFGVDKINSNQRCAFTKEFLHPNFNVIGYVLRVCCGTWSQIVD